MVEVEWGPKNGGLVSDISPDVISGGGLFTTIPETGALNIRSVGDGTNLSPSYEPIRGDLFSNGFTQPALQNRIFRIYIDNTVDNNQIISFYTPNGIIGTFTTIQVVAASPILTNLNTNRILAIQNILTGLGQTFNPATTISVVTGTNTGYIQVEITTVPYWDYDIRNRTDIVVANRIDATIKVSQEAVDASMLGFWNEIGSDDRIGDLFQFWTTRTTLPVTIPVTGAVNNGAGLIRLTVVGHNLSNNFAVDVKSVGGVPNATGIWIVNVIDADTVDLLGSTFGGAYTSGGTLTSYIYGYGQITVSQKDQNTQTWTGTLLLRSKEFNFTTLFPIDCRAKRKQDLNIAIYFVDFFNNDRVFYYKGAYITNGALSINGGIYEYGTINEELRWSLSAAGFKVEFDNIIPSGGNVRSGNWYYYARFGTQNLSFTDWTLGSTRAVPVGIGESNGTPYNFFGNNAGVATPVQVQLHVEIPIQNLFTYVEIAGVNKLDGGFTGEVIGRYVLNGSASQVITHTGFETNVTNLDTSTLNQLLSNIECSRNVELINNRAVTSHLKFGATPDLSEWAQSLTYNIRRTIGFESTGSFIGNTMAIGEYQDPQNVYHQASLMLNERYRWSIKVRWRQSGALSPAYWARDIIINDDDTQPGCNPGSALADFNLTNAGTGTPNPYSFYVNFDTPNLDFVVDGLRIRDWVSEIYYFRCEVDNPQVLSSGIIVAAVSGLVNVLLGDQIYWRNKAVFAIEAGEFPFVGGVDIPNVAPLDYFYGDLTAAFNFTIQPHYGSYYAYDYSSGHRPATIQVGDIMRNYGEPDFVINAYPDTVNFDYLWESNGVLNPTYVDVIIDEGYLLQKGESVQFIAGLAYSKYLEWITPTPYNYEAPQGLVVYSAAQQFDVLTGFQDRGFRNVQHIRLIADGDTQYGAKSESKYVFTGASILVDGNEPANLDVFGGDCFTQKTWLKNRYPVVGNPSTDGMGQGLGFYAQNRANFQFRTGVNSAGFTAFPFCTPNPLTTAQAWLQETELECNVYNEGYTLTNQIVLSDAFDPLKDYIQDARNWIRYSSKESDGSFTDALRVFGALSFRVMDYTFGYVTEFKNINEHPIVVQQSKETVLNFNDAAIFSSRNGGEILTADSGVMDQKGIVFSKFGSSHKWSIRQGKNARGNDVLYGWDQVNQCIWRYGYNGEDNLSEMQLIASFCKNNMRYVYNKDNPFHSQGIASFANQRKREIGWTFRGWKEGIDEWTEPVFHMEHQFDNTNGNGAYGDLIEVNGILYGTTSLGGTLGGGIIFSFSPTTGVFTKLFEFTLGSVAQGYAPSAGLTFANGKLYGVTPIGGANNFGTIFSINLNGTGFTKEFDMVLASGATPTGEMIVWNNKLYGMTSAGGSTTFGVLFEYDYLTTTYTELFEFTGTAGSFPGRAPQGKLYTDGTYLYGLTSQGGATLTGVLFQYDLTTYTVLHNFVSALVTVNGGATPLDSLTKNGSKLYGTASAGGLNGDGVLFEFDLLTLTYTVIHNFILASGSQPLSTPTISGNNLYGTTRLGGSAGYGVLWSYNIVTNIFSKIHDFVSPDIYPRGQQVLLNNILYGTTVGTTIVNYGTIYSYSLLGYYNIGDVVQSGTTSFEQIPAFYVSLIDDNVSNPPPSLADPPAWELIPTTDSRYYSFFTLIYSELKDAWQLFMSPKPKVYFQFGDGYGTCRPVGDTGTNYEADVGSNDPPEWWNDGSTSLIGYGYFDSVINVPPKIKKTGIALKYTSEIAPDRVEVSTENQITFMDILTAGDMETRENITDMSIKNDATVTLVGQNGAAANPTGSPDIDTSKLWGKWFVVRTIMRQYNRIDSYVMNLRARARMPEKENVNNR